MPCPDPTLMRPLHTAHTANTTSAYDEEEKKEVDLEDQKCTSQLKDYHDHYQSISSTKAPDRPDRHQFKGVPSTAAKSASTGSLGSSMNLVVPSLQNSTMAGSERRMSKSVLSPDSKRISTIAEEEAEGEESEDEDENEVSDKDSCKDATFTVEISGNGATSVVVANGSSAADLQSKKKKNPVVPVASSSSRLPLSPAPPETKKFSTSNTSSASTSYVSARIGHLNNQHGNQQNYQNHHHQQNQPNSKSANSRSSIFSWTRKRAIRFMSTVGQSLDQSIASVQSFLSPPPDPTRTGTSAANGGGNAHPSHHHHQDGRTELKSPGVCGNGQQQQLPRPKTSLSNTGDCFYYYPGNAYAKHAARYMPTGDPFWYHKAYYESKTKQTTANGANSSTTATATSPPVGSSNGVGQMDHFYYVYENGYIKKKWVCCCSLTFT